MVDGDEVSRAQVGVPQCHLARVSVASGAYVYCTQGDLLGVWLWRSADIPSLKGGDTTVSLPEIISITLTMLLQNTTYDHRMRRAT